jgi:NodT family efflux transporter outer membrane factor (OMF) lipoprotein
MPETLAGKLDMSATGPSRGGAAGLILAGLALLAQGCAALPARAPGPAVKSAAIYGSATSLPPGDAAWPTDRWWTAYGDAQLDGLIDEALAGSPSFAAALARARSADALRRQAGSALYPQLSANGEIAEAKQSYNNGIPLLFVPKGYNDTGRFTLDADWDLDLWGKTLAALRAQAMEARASAADAQAARLTLTTAVASAYADLAKAYDDRDAAEAALKNRQETAEITRQRLDNGLETRGSQRQTVANSRSASADLLATDEAIGLTRHRLAALLGKGPDRGLTIARPTAKALRVPGLPAAIGVDLAGRRPDVAAARWRVEAAAQRIRKARADFYPDVNISAFIGYQALTLASLSKSGSDVGSVGPALRLPIFTGGRTLGALRGAQADYDAAVAAYDQTLSAALQDVADVMTSEHTLGRRREQLEGAANASEDAWRIAKIRYEAGLTPLTTLLVAEDQLIAARHALADVNARALTLDVSLVRALGGGFRADGPQ